MTGIYYSTIWGYLDANERISFNHPDAFCPGEKPEQLKDCEIWLERHPGKNHDDAGLACPYPHGSSDCSFVLCKKPKHVVSCAGTKCSDGSDGAACGPFSGCCPFLDGNNFHFGAYEKCFCGISREDANQNKIPCPVFNLNEPAYWHKEILDEDWENCNLVW